MDSFSLHDSIELIDSFPCSHLQTSVRDALAALNIDTFYGPIRFSNGVNNLKPMITTQVCHYSLSQSISFHSTREKERERERKRERKKERKRGESEKV